MEFKVVVKLRSYGLNFWQKRPGNLMKVVMFVMIADVQRDHVERTIIAECGLPWPNVKMLLEPTCAKRVEAD